jgi:hypothetical protein
MLIMEGRVLKVIKLVHVVHIFKPMQKLVQNINRKQLKLLVTYRAHCAPDMQFCFVRIQISVSEFLNIRDIGSDLLVMKGKPCPNFFSGRLKPKFLL